MLHYTQPVCSSLSSTGNYSTAKKYKPDLEYKLEVLPNPGILFKDLRCDVFGTVSSVCIRKFGAFGSKISGVGLRTHSVTPHFTVIHQRSHLCGAKTCAIAVHKI